MAGLRSCLVFASRHAHVALLVAHSVSDMLNVLLLAVVRELVGLLVVVIISHVDVDVVLGIGAVVVEATVGTSVVVDRPLEASTPSTLNTDAEALGVDGVRHVLRVVQVLLGVPTLAKRRLGAAHLVVISLKILREYLRHCALLAAHGPGCRVLLHGGRANWSQFLIDATLGADTDEIILWRRVLEARPSF